MKRADLEIIFEEFSKCHIGVLGDYCLDAYWALDDGERELSVETGKPTHAVTHQRYTLGGAGNIVANLSALGVGSVQAFSVVGNDLFGRELLNQLDQLDVDCSGMVQDNDWQTPIYCKRYQGAEELERIDIGRFNAMNTDAETSLIHNVRNSISDLDVLIVNRQLVGGVHSEALFEQLLVSANETDCQIIIDFRDLPSSLTNMFVKLNAHEAGHFCGDTWDLKSAIPEDKVKDYAERIFGQSGRPVMITRSERGLLIYDGKTHAIVSGIQFLKPIDPVGAGDTTIAMWATCLASDVELSQASQLANFSAGVTVQKIQETGTASPEEIINFAEDVDIIYHPELAEDSRKARYLPDSQIEIVTEHENLGNIQHAVFDHDGTISVLREGWEPVMEAMMIRAILGDDYNDVVENDYQRISAHAQQFIDKSTGIQTIVQMQSLVEMITEFGFVADNAILTASEYKEIYNDALMQQINQRIQRVRSGELGVADFTLKGAVDMLQGLYDRGVTLYLASGTDAEDVKIEAEILGYAHLFEGRIYGAVGDIRKYSKKMVIDQIIRENNLKGAELITFGDGPVEIRETKKRGGITVGIASDEVRRFGLNIVKRSRLIRAGADYIIPDYAQMPVLMRHLMG
jgi:rfaE bifunctional protein kinase chain/domain